LGLAAAEAQLSDQKGIIRNAMNHAMRVRNSA
jgi:hypothetical protein